MCSAAHPCPAGYACLKFFAENDVNDVVYQCVGQICPNAQQCTEYNGPAPDGGLGGDGGPTSFACVSVDSGAPDSGEDAASDAEPMDASDATLNDSSTDATVDGPTDAVSDVQADATPDSGSDSGSDAGSDANCGNTQTDPLNCGACGHSCLGGTCVNGQCQVVVLESVLTPGGVVVDGNSVYFTSNAAPDGGFDAQGHVYSCGLLTCPSPAVVYASGAGNETENTAGSISASTGVLYMPYPGSMAGIQEVAENAVNSPGVQYASLGFFPSVTVATDATYAYYSTQSAVNYSLLNPLPAVPVTAISIGATFVTVDTNNLYAVNSFGKTVVSCAIGSLPCGGTYTTIASSFVNTPTNAFSDGTNLWIGAGSSGVFKCPIGPSCGSPPPAFASTAVPVNIVADANYVYWTDSSANAVLRCSAAASTCASPTVLASVMAPGTLAQNATALYFSGGNSLLMLAK